MTAGTPTERQAAQLDRFTAARWDPARAARPVVALDLDGVLNPQVRQAAFTEFELRVEPGVAPTSPFVPRVPDEGLVLRVRSAPYNVEWVWALTELADVVWATSWEQLAVDLYAPAVGLPELPFVPHSLWKPRLEDARAGNPVPWKLRGLDACFRGRPLCWVDDLAFRYRHTEGWWDAPALVVTPDERTGVVAADRAAVLDFVRHHQP